jgi:hypothetical protein
MSVDVSTLGPAIWLQYPQQHKSLLEFSTKRLTFVQAFSFAKQKEKP